LSVHLNRGILERPISVTLKASIESISSRYVVGIDLGTTNSAVSYVDTDEKPWQVLTFAVPQLVAPGVVEAREILPSFLYQPVKGEFGAVGRRKGEGGRGKAGEQSAAASAAVRRPPSAFAAEGVVGFFARDQGALVPGRLIASAKSWLCHSGVDRTADLLPWHGAADVERLSPIEASARYLRHMADAWDARERADLQLGLVGGLVGGKPS
jgi:molecular chaperone DnaK (HSP70)